MQKYGEGKYFKWTVPNNGFSGLVFTCSNYDIGNFDNRHQQSTNITYDKSSSFYQFEDDDDNGKIKGNWIHIPYPKKTTFYLDVTNIKDWNNPYVYMWNKNSNNTGLIPMTQEDIWGGEKSEIF